MTSSNSPQGSAIVEPAVTDCRVGIGMPVYNGEQYLEETLSSVLSQSYDDFKLFIADNASTDRTEQICRDYASRDSRIHYIRNAVNVGAAGNYTVCFKPSNHDYFRWQNADDPIEPILLERCVKTLDDNPQAVLAYCKTKIIDQDGQLIEYYDDKLDLRQENASERFMSCLGTIGLSNVLYGLMRRDLLAKTALFGSYLASDINLIAELTLYGLFHEIPEYAFCRRMHPQCSSWDRADNERQKNFWDPSKRKLRMQTWRSFYEYFKAVARAPVAVQEKIALFHYLCRRVNWYREPLADEILDLFRYRIINRS